MQSTQCIVTIYDSNSDRVSEAHEFDSVDKGNALCDTVDLKPEVKDGSIYYDIEVRRTRK